MNKYFNIRDGREGLPVIALSVLTSFFAFCPKFEAMKNIRENYCNICLVLWIRNNPVLGPIPFLKYSRNRDKILIILSKSSRFRFLTIFPLFSLSKFLAVLQKMILPFFYVIWIRI